MKEKLLVYNESNDVKMSAGNTKFIDSSVKKNKGFHDERVFLQ